MKFATLQEATFDAHDSNISPHPKNIETAKNRPFLETFLGVLDLNFAENNMRGSQLSTMLEQLILFPGILIYENDTNLEGRPRSA